MDPLMAGLRLELIALILASARLVAFFLVLPLIPRSLVTGIVRNGVLTAMALVVQPAVKAALGGIEPDSMQILLLVLKETMLGAAMGFVLGAVFWGVEGAGFFIDNQRGAAIAGSIDPLSGSDSAPMGILFLQLFTAWIFVSGAFMSLLSLLYDTYVFWPVLTFWPKLPPELPSFFLGVADDVMRLTVLLAGPVFIVMFASEMALALVSRFASQLNVFVLAMPVKSGVAFFMLALYLPFLVQYLVDQWRATPEALNLLRRLLE